MSREFKFRAWENGSMYFQVRCGGVFDSIPTAPTVWNSMKGDWLNLTGQPYTTVMQYTGIKDSNGIEVYEGDILDYRSDKKGVLRHEVVFEAPSFSRKWLNKSTAQIRNRETEPLAWNTHIIYEVIGNIYDNPELLGDAK